MVVDFAIDFLLVRPGWPRYPVFVHRAAALLHASFRPRLATAPLRFANPSPLSGWIEDFHLQAVDHARHTANGSRECAPDDRLREAIHAGASESVYGISVPYWYSEGVLCRFRPPQAQGPALPERLARAFRPRPVIVLAANAVLAHVGQDLARRRQALGIDPLVRIP